MEHGIVHKKEEEFLRSRARSSTLAVHLSNIFFIFPCCAAFFSLDASSLRHSRFPSVFYIIYLLGDFRNERLANGARKMKRAKLSFHSLAQNVISSKSHAIEITTFIDSITGHNIFSLCECCCCECWIFFTKR